LVSLSDMSQEQQQIEAAIQGLESQRALLGDALVDAALEPLRARLLALSPAKPGTIAQTLKQVTVLFLDVVGSTTLSQFLDPEEIHAVMDGALARCTNVVELHKGKVFQYAGDSLLAVFGSHEAQEDDPERAVRAGLALLEEGRRQGDLVKRQYGHDGFDVRVGVHTGAVLLGRGVGEEGSLWGMTVNIAARMEQTAPAGALRISRDTYRHVRGVFDVEEQPPLQVKGKDAPIVTYLVRRAKPRAFRIPSRGIEGIETPFIGRDTELRDLRDAFETVLTQRTLQARTLVGDAGLGKSRLLAEFQAALEAYPQPFWLLLGRAEPRGELQPYGLLRNLFAHRLQIADSDGAEVARHKLLESVLPLLGDEASVHMVGHLIGLDFSASPHVAAVSNDARQLRDRAFGAALLLLQRLSESDGSPLVMLLDDLHWADDGSLDFVEHLLQSARGLPLLLVMLGRPSLFERRPAWRHGDLPHRRIDVVALDDDESGTLVDALLQHLSGVPAALRDILTRGAEGNPFYMEELVLMLIDDGVIVVDYEAGNSAVPAWSVVPDRLVAAHVPTTLTGVLQARLDALRTRQKIALQQASVIGPVFWDDALASIDSVSPSELPGSSYVERHATSAFDGTRERAFTHHLLHQVTYDTVLKRDKQLYHAEAARWLSARMGERSGEHLAAVAEHYARAGNRTEALKYFERAADEAELRFANMSALGHARHALALTEPGDTELRWKLLGLLYRVADIQGDRTEQERVLGEMTVLAEILDHLDKRAQLAFRRSLFAGRIADYTGEMAHARDCVALAEPGALWAQAATAYCQWAAALMRLGDSDAARERAQAGLSAARRSGEAKPEAQLHSVMGSIEVGVGRYTEAVKHLTRALLLARAGGHRRLEGVVLSNLSGALSATGDYAAALPHLEAGLEISRAIGNRAAEAIALVNMAQWRLGLHDIAGAVSESREAVRLSRETGDAFVEAHGLMYLGEALSAATQEDEAQACFVGSIALFERLAVPQMLQARAQYAEMMLGRGDLATAMTQVENIVTALQSGFSLDGVDEPRRIELVCHRVLAAAGDDRAAAWLVQAHTRLMAQAAHFEGAARDRFLTNVPWNRVIVDRFADFGPPESPGAKTQRVP
jgi:class 3 adenylate cyclase/tetratricopeptide (TPR) repeat protein